MYITIAEVIDKFPAQLIMNLLNDECVKTVDWNNPCDPLAKRLAGIISDAEKEVNGYLFGYTLPFQTPPSVLSVITLDVVLYYCYRRRMSNDIPGYIQKNYSDRIAFLGKVAEGKISLGNDTPDETRYFAVSYTDNNFLDY